MSVVTRWTARFVLVTAVLATIGCDRVTKHIVSTTLVGTPARSYLADTVWVGYVENQGGFLGLGSNLPLGMRTAIFTVATGAMLAALIAFGLRRRLTDWSALGLALFVAGGASNWIDRVAHGRVVDFLRVGVGPVRTGVFNVADVAIMIGALVIIWGETASSPRTRDVSTDDGTA